MATTTKLDEFRRIAESRRGWNSIDQLQALLERAGFWNDDDQIERATESYKKSQIRRLARKVCDGAGWPIIASIIMTDPHGRQRRVYMSENLFDVEKYRQVVEYHRGRGLRHIHLANGYARRCRERLGRQLPLPFPEHRENS